MVSFAELAIFSPLPIVDLRSPSFPSDGLIIGLPDSCKKNFHKGEACRKHYSQLTILSTIEPHRVFQCPFGLASFPFRLGSNFVALTGVIPFPRQGGDEERLSAKRNPENKISIDRIRKAAGIISEAVANVEKTENEILRRHSAALHEIRKLNGKIKQNAERLSESEEVTSSEIRQKTLTIYKASEMMSNQFDVLQALANLEITDLPLNTTIEVRQLFFKCIRIYDDPESRVTVKITGTQNYTPRVPASDKTFQIIATVLISNAKKYASPDSTVEVIVEKSGELCRVAVKNESEGNVLLNETVFERGVRVSDDTDGTGNGLYVAQLVALQHKTRITVRSRLISESRTEHIFEIFFQTIGQS